ncbi:MAG: hypothetical protein BAA01_09470 [Bacillus thermozeamaize]|uniref:Uncharacterized protein n=1 Tax=Bacillus thermozeamaize TaxID=230954 RepID=A0A1Y3PHQ2_9BACI|nr:MAG: hypothetical protein BAA01_09470 [Bacillus thermozeamaize]
MRELKIGDQTVRVRATPLALLYYRQEFGSDLFGDLLKMAQSLVGVEAIAAGGGQIDLSRINLAAIDSVGILQLIWAMAKADAFGRQFPSFQEWVASLESFDLFSGDTLTAVFEEAANGFFRSRAAGIKGGVR